MGLYYEIDGLMQNWKIYIANALQILESCTRSSKLYK